MSFKKILKGFLLAYGTVTLMERHGDDVAKWLEKKAAEIGRKAGEKYCVPVDHKLVFKEIFNFDSLRPGDSYYISVGDVDRFDLLRYDYGDDETDRLNQKYDCYILVEE